MNTSGYEVSYYSPDFEKNADRLVTKKKFKKLPAQIASLVADFEKGLIKGDVIFRSDNPPYEVIKIRVPNEDTNVGKSDGYRVIYLAKHDSRSVALLFIYYKKEQETVSDAYVKALIEGYFLDLISEDDD
jgi:mRNA-degrading endonuclease RelE of RelBE toxin-antitoxin system